MRPYKRDILVSSPYVGHGYTGVPSQLSAFVYIDAICTGGLKSVAGRTVTLRLTPAEAKQLCRDLAEQASMMGAENCVMVPDP